MTELVNAKPDGYLICITASGPTTSLPHKEKVPYTRDDYIPIVQLTNVPNLLVTYPGSPYNTFEEVLNAAKKNPNSVKVAISGIGAVSSHLPLIQLEKKTGAKFKVIPYKGGGGAAIQVLGGHVPVGSVDLMAAGRYIESGKLKALAIFADRRSPVLPDTPTLKELGYDIQGSFFNMIIVPKGTPENIINTLKTAFKKAIEDEAVLSAAKNIGLQIEYLGPEGCRERIDRDYKMIGELYEELGIAKKN
jgi:tripartite-type tricarboxylate transporter receptor subunit TctC